MVQLIFVRLVLTLIIQRTSYSSEYQITSKSNEFLTLHEMVVGFFLQQLTELLANNSLIGRQKLQTCWAWRDKQTANIKTSKEERR